MPCSISGSTSMPIRWRSCGGSTASRDCSCMPFVAGMPRKNGAAVAPPAEVMRMLLEPPPRRPGGGGSAPEPARSRPRRARHRPAARAPGRESGGLRANPRRDPQAAESRSHRRPSDRRLRADRALSPGAARMSAAALDAADRGAGACASARKALSPVELTEACLDRIAQVDDRLQSFICLAPDALEQARACRDGDRARQLARPAARHPVGVKDNYLTRGHADHRGHHRARHRVSAPRLGRGGAAARARARC